jgi:hypothetical protein
VPNISTSRPGSIVGIISNSHEFEGIEGGVVDPYQSITNGAGLGFIVSHISESRCEPPRFTLGQACATRQLPKHPYGITKVDNKGNRWYVVWHYFVAERQDGNLETCPGKER